MSTFSQLADQVSLNLSGFTLRQDRQTHLTSALTSTGTTISVASASNIGAGIIEIDDELIYVDSFDRSAKTLSVPPYGRGYQGTTKSTHAAGTKVTITPTFPRYMVKQAINDTINSVFPDLFSVKSTTFTYTGNRRTYAMPNNLETVLSVRYQAPGSTKTWVAVRQWYLDPMANVGEFGSNNSITIGTDVPFGRTVQVTYTTQPGVLETDSDDFSLMTGLPTTSQDVITTGAAYRLLSYVDPGRLTFGSAEADQQSQIAGRAYGAGTNTAKYLLALYQQRLAEESRKLGDRYPIMIHRMY